LLPAAERMARTTSALENLWGGAKVNIGKGLMQSDRLLLQRLVHLVKLVWKLWVTLNNLELRKLLTLLKNMVMSDGMELEEINRAAAEVGDWVGLNTALLTATNYIQLLKYFLLLFKAEKNIK
jgi:hypothetical protein